MAHLYGVIWILAGLAAVARGAPAVSRFYEPDNREVSRSDAARPLMAVVMRSMVRFVGAATILGGVLIVLFPEHL